MNALLLLVMVISLAVGFLAACFVFVLGYRFAEMHANTAQDELELERHRASLGRGQDSEEAEEHPVEPELLGGAADGRG